MTSTRGVLGLTALALVASSLAGLRTEATAPVAEVALPSHPRRIVSLGLHNDEIALAVARERVIAVDAFADDPDASFVAEEARAVPSRATASAESILSLRPDLVLLPGWVSAELDQAIRRAGVAVHREPVPGSLAEIRQSVARLGEILDAEEGARALTEELDRALAELDARPRADPPPSVVLLAATGTSPGRNTLFAELVARAGGRIALEREGISMLPLETLLRIDPDVLLVDVYRADGTGRALGAELDEVVPAGLRGSLRAVRDGRLHALTARTANTTSHHVVEALRELADLLPPRRLLPSAARFSDSL